MFVWFSLVVISGMGNNSFVEKMIWDRQFQSQITDFVFKSSFLKFGRFYFVVFTIGTFVKLYFIAVKRLCNENWNFGSS